MGKKQGAQSLEHGVNKDELIKSQKTTFSVIPAKAGIHEYRELLDPSFRRGDGLENFLRDRL